MLEKIKEKYYRYGIIVAADGEESENAKIVIEKYGVKMVKKNSIMYNQKYILISVMFMCLRQKTGARL